MEQDTTSKKRIVIVVIAIVIVVIGAVAVLLMKRDGSAGSGTKSFGALFGDLTGGTVDPQNGTIKGSGADTSGSATDLSTGGEEPLFRQLSSIPVAGATVVEKNGKSYVRYIARENGYVYDVDVSTGIATQITNTTVPRIYEAFWGQKGGTVIVRYLKHDDIGRRDIIKTQIANLSLSVDGSASTSLGSLILSEGQLPDDISFVSVSQSGTMLFYLLPVSDGVSGTIVNLASRVATEVFRNPFSEWLPELLDDGNVVLTSKASADVPGYAYLYDTKKKTLSRMIREKNGLTTLANASGKRAIFSENLLGNTSLSLYDEKGFQDEGDVSHVAPLQLATLPEKCAWSRNGVRLYCGAFASTPRAKIPDEWYQGAMSFTDTFWTMDTDLTDLVFLADPKRETGRTFDVVSPFLDANESHFFFVDKGDSTLWSMRLQHEKFGGANDLPSDAASDTLPTLSPEEMKDAIGSLPTSTNKKR